MRSVVPLIATIIPAVFAYPQITSPAPGSDWDTGSVTVKWSDTGSPGISQLSGYILQLMVGGNEETNSQPVATIVNTGKFGGTMQTAGNLDPGVAGPTPNGFYLKMTCTATGGGQIIIYSSRFNIPGLTAVTPPQFVTAAQALGGKTTGPAVQNNVNAAPAAPAAGGAAGAAGAGVPYNLQSGLTKYAPMQGIPPTKITAKGNPTPLFPTSAVTIATTFLPLASIVSTVTVPQTFSVQSVENSASAQPQPSDDMAKFLARWKD